MSKMSRTYEDLYTVVDCCAVTKIILPDEDDCKFCEDEQVYYPFVRLNAVIYKKEAVE